MERKKVGKSLDVNMNFIPPAEKPKQPRKCPFRKIYYTYSDDWVTTLKNATKIVEEFQECIGNECACYTPFGCGRR